MLRSVLLVSWFLAAISSAAYAQEKDGDHLENQIRVLDKINETATIICQRVSSSGEATSFGIEGDATLDEARLELDRLLNFAIDLGIAGASRFEKENYKGVLREELADVVKSSNECRHSVFDRLSVILLSSPGNSAILDPRVRTTSLPGQGSFQYVNEYISMSVMSAAQSNDGERMNIAFLIQNVSGQVLYLVIDEDEIYNTNIAFDDVGNSYDFDQISGIGTFTRGIDASDWTRMAPGSIQTVVLKLDGIDSKTKAKTVSFALDLFAGIEGAEQSRTISVGMSNIVVQ